MKIDVKETINEIEVKKDLYKSKAIAKMSHYVGGNVYYTVELSDGTYQFPMSTTEKVNINDVDLRVKEKDEEDKDIYVPVEDTLLIYDKDEEEYVEATFRVLSEDLGTTTFYAEMRGSELGRWIAKAIKSGDFIKVL